MNASRRELEARIFAQLAALDDMIVEADREIKRLQRALRESRQTAPAERRLTGAEQQRCFALYEAGLNSAEIAHCLRAPQTRVEEVLNQFHNRAA